MITNQMDALKTRLETISQRVYGPANSDRNLADSTFENPVVFLHNIPKKNRSAPQVDSPFFVVTFHESDLVINENQKNTYLIMFHSENTALGRISQAKRSIAVIDAINQDFNGDKRLKLPNVDFYCTIDSRIEGHLNDFEFDGLNYHALMKVTVSSLLNRPDFKGRDSNFLQS